jgi:hypothetical protein
MTKQFFMKIYSGLILIAGTLLFGCGKVKTYSTDYSAAAFINAAPGNTTFNVLVDGISQTATALVFKGTSPYLNVSPGQRNIVIRNTNPAQVVDYKTLTESFVTNTASTFVVYDTLATVTSALRTVRLNDDLSAPATGFVKFRFLPLAIFSPEVDVTYLRTSVTPNDSVTVSNLAYIGNNPSAATLSKIEKFITLPGGSYTIKQKLTGTQTLYSTPVTFNPTVAGAFKGIYTFYTNGTAQGQPLGVNVFRNFP